MARGGPLVGNDIKKREESGEEASITPPFERAGFPGSAHSLRRKVTALPTRKALDLLPRPVDKVAHGRRKGHAIFFARGSTASSKCPLWPHLPGPKCRPLTGGVVVDKLLSMNNTQIGTWP